MKILSWNCYLPPWSATRNIRPILICGKIFDLKPDVVCLQEVFLKSDADFIYSVLGKFYPYFCRFKNLLIMSKYPMEKPEGKVFNKQGRLFSFAILDRLYGKGFQYATLDKNGEKYIIANTHLLSANAYKNKQYQKVRKEQLKELCKHIEDMGYKKIIAGDFNFENDTLPYSEISENKYTDILLAGENTTKDKRLDYVITKNIPNTKINLASNLKEKLSDHMIMMLEIGE